MKKHNIICAFVVLLVANLVQNKVLAQLSPGDLIKDHAHLDGMSNCTQCHTFGEGIPSKKCLDCHKEINSLVKQKRGYHAAAEVSKKNCIDCHSDHHGRNFKSIQLDENTFDHKKASYTLEGAHAKVSCAKCHATENIASPKIAKRKGTYLGLGIKCLDCHADNHQQTLANTCLDCHNMDKFKPASKFNHSKAKFVLTGKHLEVDCKECHKSSIKNNKDFTQYTGIAFAKCTDCHADKHNGQFGQNCLECHTVNSFSTLKKGVEFDHNRTKFPLVGLHNNVACSTCHSGKSYTSPNSYVNCKSCHSDYHKGDFVKKNNSIDCKDCHDLNHHFNFSTYSIEQHNQSSFQLKGAHLATPCFACHQKSSTWDFSNIGNTCGDCHGDEHKDQISPQFYSLSKCNSCHSEESWASISFKHDQTNYTLTGKHASANCIECHYPANKNTAASKPKFFKPTNDCAQCHDNNHGTQFQINAVTDCNRCHESAVSWTADKFEHSKTQFPLEGAHQQANCSACHKPNDAQNNSATIQYKIKKFKCIDCHS